MDTIKVYGENTKEHTRLEAATMLINAEFDSHFGDAEVRDMYWDYGGGVMWTTIVFKGDYQALDPLNHAMIVLGNMDDFAAAVKHVIERHRHHIQLVNNLRYGAKRDGKAEDQKHI